MLRNQNVTGWQPVDWRHGLCLNCEQRADVEGRFRVCVRSETDAMRAPPGRRVPGRTIYHCLFLFRTRAPESAFLRHRPLLFPTSRCAPTRSTPRSSWAPSFPRREVYHACTWILIIKGHRFAHSKKRVRSRSSRADNVQYITISLCLREPLRQIFVHRICFLHTYIYICTYNKQLDINFLDIWQFCQLIRARIVRIVYFFHSCQLRGESKDVVGWGGAGLMVSAIWR